MMSQQNPKEKDKLQLLLERYQREQREFENHPLWKQLGTTPKGLSEMTRREVQKRGVSPAEWQVMLVRQMQIIKTQVRERVGEYEPVNFKRYSGLRA
jgi:hypothetical protein